MEKFKFIINRIKAGRLKEMLQQTIWIYSYVRRYWKYIILYTLIGLSGTVVSLVSGIISKNLIDIITGNQSGSVATTFIVMIATNLGVMFINQFSGLLASWINLRVDNEIKADIFEKILDTDWEALTNYHTGDLLTRWSSDASTISNGVLNWIPDLIMNIFQFICAFAIVIYYDATFAIFAFIGIPFSLLMSKKLMNRMVNNNQKSAAMSAKLSGFNQEAFSNVQTIKAFNLVKLYCDKLRSLQKEFVSMKMDFQKMSIATSFLMTLISMFVSYSSYGWGIYRVWSGAISYGTMTLFLNLSGQLTSSLNSLISLVPSAIGLTTSAGRLMDIIDMPREDHSRDEEILQFIDKNSTDGIAIRLNDVSYMYKDGNKYYHDITFEAKPHEIIAFVGASGEGKTTLLRVLLSLIPVKNGDASLIGLGTDETFPLSPSTRNVFSYVPQGNTMFSGTIAENMRNIKPDATDEEIISALKLACAWEFIEKLPDGINSMIKERGGGLSEGQAQRISIARALLHNSPVLLLDEATSALDAETEAKVLKNITSDATPRTCIVTTHRPSVLDSCKRIYKIENQTCQVIKSGLTGD